MISLYIADAILAVFFIVMFVVDQFTFLSNQADDLENWIASHKWTSWFHYNVIGDPISWIQHGLFSLIVASSWGVMGWALLGEFWTGFFHGAVEMAAFYTVRELAGIVRNFKKNGMLGAIKRHEVIQVYQKGYYVGWLIDAIGDVTLPYAVLGFAWRMV